MDISTPCIKCQVHSKYIEEQSEPTKNRYVFAYIITIRNLSKTTVQLMSRRWLITDSNGKQLTIEGDGVVGQQPVIEANDEYTYTSGTVIETPVGVMQGHYVMTDHKGLNFITEVDPFRLAIPNILN
ncbi:MULTISPECIES: Co2+/Mg2+ efflux protein ApaG [Vibrio]|uniref:Protein ApaG n=2 Tax=Vibrio TaxID=662 RepID=A0A2N7JK56_VIBSP|nr:MULTISPECIES: Co2+/Mg2+ efflux protein ApaG [Vibrio]MCF7503897.1 Co2+/Mg2+ efflux protein ApaG [Vibrio sp. L3-7]PMM40995.1 Co2+/Mg2+ efflux protein ApaG [Vibrio splendidus]TVU62540.1 Co2+/Mg2+ efflux protein ApaG [Vibrio atlanticus]TVU76424.1 Co2+/Mg2+ efflux protein ApaG [Vibrio tasmaniensis]